MSENYESPILVVEQATKSFNETVDSLIMSEVRRVGVYVNKEELVKALAYDRGQYEKGYEDAKKEMPEVIHCKDCKQFRRWVDTDICFCDITESERSEDDFCSRAERRVE